MCFVDITTHLQTNYCFVTFSHRIIEIFLKTRFLMTLSVSLGD